MNAATRLALLLCLMLCILPLSACNDGTGASVRYDISASVTNLDPQYAYTEDAKLIVRNAFEGLFESGEEGEAVPAAAESLSVSEDGLTATITLREDLRWSDGSAVTAGDYAFALRRLFTADYPSDYASDFLCIRGAAAILRGEKSAETLGVRAPDDRTLVISLEHSTDSLPYLLCSTAALPCKESFFEETRGRYGLGREMLLYNGPFRVYYWEENMVQLRPNPEYRGVEEVYPRSVTFNVADPSQHFARLEAGRTDAAILSYSEWNRLERQERYTCQQYEDTVWVLIFNENLGEETSEGRFLASAEGRRALASAVDHRVFAPDLGNDLVETTVFLPPSLRLGGESYRRQAGFTGNSLFDPQAAQNACRTAARLYGTPQITILAPDEEAHSAAATGIQRCWRDTLALGANLMQIPRSELLERVRRGEYQAAILPLRPDSEEPERMLMSFRSASAGNIAGYSSEEYDALLERASSAGSTEGRLRACRAAERMLYEEAVLVPLYFQTNYYVLAPGVEGIRFSPFAGETLFRGALKR